LKDTEKWVTTAKFDTSFAGAFKTLPVLQHKDLTLNETLAIQMYVAKRAGYLPSDEANEARAMMIVQSAYEDVINKVADAIWGFIQVDFAVGSFKMTGPADGIPMKLKNWEAILHANVTAGSSWCIGKEISVADFAVFSVIELLNVLLKPVAQGPEALDLLLRPCPQLVKLHATMRLRPNLAAYLQGNDFATCGPVLTALDSMAGKGEEAKRVHEIAQVVISAVKV